LNDEILRVVGKEVRCLGDGGDNFGIVTPLDALNIANETFAINFRSSL
jgi:translation initiation factor IF-3